MMLFVISILLINAIIVSAQLGQQASETTLQYRDAVVDNLEKDALEKLREDIESCKEDAKNEPKVLQGYDLWGQDEFKGYLRYEGARIGVYHCKNKEMDLFRLDIPSPSEDIYTSRKLSLNNPYLGDINVYYGIENARLIDDQNYEVNIYTSIKNAFYWKSQIINKNSLASGVLSEEEISKSNLLISKISAENNQLAISNEGAMVPATGNIKAARFGPEMTILGIKIPDIIARNLDFKNKFYHDSENNVILKCPEGFCKSDGLKSEKYLGGWRVVNKYTQEMSLTSAGNWVIKNQ